MWRGLAIVLLLPLLAVGQTTNSPTVRPRPGPPFSQFPAQVAPSNAAFPGAVFQATTPNTYKWTKDGGPLTNLNASALASGTVPGARFGTATATNTGGVDTNQFLLLNTPPGTQGDPTVDTPIFIESWYSTADHSTWSQTDVSNAWRSAFLNGLTKQWQVWYILDDYWQGGRTNNHLVPNSRFFWLTNGTLAALAHNWGIKLILYTEDNTVTSNGQTGSGGYDTAQTNSHGEFPIPRRDYYDEDAADWVAWGVDGVKLDTLRSANFKERIYNCRKLRAAWNAATTNSRPLFLLTDAAVISAQGTMVESPVMPCELLSVANMVRMTGDTALPGVWNEWKFEELLFRTFGLWGHCADQGRGKFIYIEHADFIGQANKQYWEFGKGTVGMRAMLGSPQSHGTLDLSDGDRWLQWTNQYLRRIARDKNRAELVQSNEAYMVWAKRLADGSTAVTLWNTATNVGAVTNCTIYFTNAYFLPGQHCGVINAWSNRIESLDTTTSFTMAVTNISAELLILYPTNTALAAPIVQVLTPQNLYWNPAPTQVTNTVAGPANMFVEAVAKDFGTNAMRFFLFPPIGATNLTIAYGLQSDSATSYWTNQFQEFQWDVAGARNFGSATDFNVNGSVNSLQRFTNSFPLSTHHPMGVRVSMLVGTNTTGSRYMCPPVVITWQ